MDSLIQIHTPILGKFFYSNILKFVFLALLFIQISCVGPLTSHETARTVGKSHSEVSGGIGNGGHVFKWTYGVMDHFDLGIQWETLSIGFRGKYSFINGKEKQWSYAAALGFGSSDWSRHQYGDLIASYLLNSWEPYTTFRIVHVSVDPIEMKDNYTNDIYYSSAASKYYYEQIILGTRYWFNPKWLMSLELSSLFSFGSDITISKNILIGVGVGYRFF